MLTNENQADAEQTEGPKAGLQHLWIISRSVIYQILVSIQGVDFDLSPTVNVSSKTAAILAQLFSGVAQDKNNRIPQARTKAYYNPVTLCMVRETLKLEA